MRMLLSLDLSKCKLADLPGIGMMRLLTDLDLSCNKFKQLPVELDRLAQLVSLNASRNFLQPTAKSLLLPGLKQLSNLRLLDLRFNAKLGQQQLLDMLAAELPKVTARITIWGQIVGISAAVRDASLLRSQLEPWPTPVLRRRLAEDFGEYSLDLDELGRAEVMQRLLDCYAREGVARKVIKVDGVPVSASRLRPLLEELRRWASQHNYNRERPSISAKSYMILRSPTLYDKGDSSISARRAAAKSEKFIRIWELAFAAIAEVDPEFAAEYTALAVTYGFQGSPHIDKQNCGPFYGLALGEFSEGQGGICVECNARTVAEVNTRNRLGKVDGRFPHWVAPYDADAERYSLIYYRTEGEYAQPHTAIFSSVLR